MPDEAMTEVETELRHLRADPLYSIDGADEVLVQREIKLLIMQAYAREVERAQLQRTMARY